MEEGRSSRSIVHGNEEKLFVLFEVVSDFLASTPQGSNHGHTVRGKRYPSWPEILEPVLFFGWRRFWKNTWVTPVPALGEVSLTILFSGPTSHQL